MTKENLLTLLIFFVLASCDSTRILYRSTDSRKNYWTVNAYTMSHCGCTQLFIEKYKNGKNEFQIMYTDDFALKNVYDFNEKGAIADTVTLIAKTNNFDIPFDSLDHEMFKRIKAIVVKKEGLVYEMKWTEYQGFKRKDQ